MKLTHTVFLALAALPGVLCAQDSILGTYNGSISQPSSSKNPVIGVSIVISGFEDGKVTAKGMRSTGPCRGEYPLEGTYKDGALLLRTVEKGGRAADCNFTFKGTVDGGALVGALGGREIKLSK